MCVCDTAQISFTHFGKGHAGGLWVFTKCETLTRPSMTRSHYRLYYETAASDIADASPTANVCNLDLLNSAH